jgi:hypothetical protein
MAGGSGRWGEGTRTKEGVHPCEEEETKGKVQRRPNYETEMDNDGDKNTDVYHFCYIFVSSIYDSRKTGSQLVLSRLCILYYDVLTICYAM